MPKITKTKNVKDLTRLKYLAVLPNFKDQQTQKLTSIIFTMIAISLFGIFAINPTISTIVKLRKQLVDNRFVEQGLEEKIKNLNVLAQKYTGIQNDAKYVLDAIPTNPKSPLLMAQIQSIADETDITLSNLQNLAVDLFKEIPNSQTQHYSYSFSINANGKLEDITAFLSRIVIMQRIINIDNFSINQTTDKDGLLSFTLQGTAFYKP